MQDLNMFVNFNICAKCRANSQFNKLLICGCDRCQYICVKSHGKLTNAVCGIFCVIHMQVRICHPTFCYEDSSYTGRQLVCQVSGQP